MSGLPVLSLLLWLPVLGALICILLPERAAQVRLWGLVVAGVSFVIASVAWLGYDPASGMAYVERVRWVPSYGLEYHLGLDGLSAPLVTLNALLGALAIAGSGERANRRGYTALLLASQGAVAGALLALDLALFFVCFEVMLLPIVLLVGIYGNDGRTRAAITFFLYTTAGSLLMLLSIIALPFFASHDGAPLDVLALARAEISPATQTWLFVGFALAFAVKMPLFPLHTWLPALYEAAPTPALVFTTMLVKVGAYGFLRIVIPILPDAATRFAPMMMVLSIAGILYGGVLAATASNLVRVLAYGSIAHLGFIGLGIWSLTQQGAQGAIIQMVNHGVTSAALFLLATYLLRRTGTLELSRLGGLAGRWPVLAWLMLLATVSSLGLPGLNNFVGEFLVLLGAFRAAPIYALAVVGVLLAAIYSIRYYRLIFHGRDVQPEPPDGGRPAADLRPLELWPLVPLVALIVLLGIYPGPVLRTTEDVARSIVEGPAQLVERAATTDRRLPWTR